MTVVSRLRKDAALRTRARPAAGGAARAGPGPTATDVIDLAKRAGQRRGWSTETFDLYGEQAVKRYKTFLATWRPAGGVIRVVLVDEPTGWRAYFCTDPSASVADILATVADRFSLEITFRECKEVVGAGQQQVRFVWANVGAFHVCLWTFTMTEAWAWGRKDGGVGGPLGLAVGRARHAARATRTSGGRGVVSCWARKFVRFYAPGSPRRKFRPRPNGCSAWPHDMQQISRKVQYRRG